ncbi:SIMPL domain-containing protein [Alteromonas halophila]|uniref:SIMPL domain-containing protein n=1 Tax=Alteromonas halophila TaxID=516698 RepID=A0A918MZB2_9ALTE|nr:SIMPL domain-containing protein [Alteromonas halophila]GGW88470.1 SIMPL domain-containing protein [Alteromonas halophila]
MKQILFVVISLVFSISATAQQQTVIEVNGQGAVNTVPDGFVLEVVLEEKGETVSKLNQALQHELTQVVDFLLEQGVEKAHIQSMQVRLQPNYVSTPNGREPQGFVLAREVRITQQSITTFDAIIDGILQRGVDRINKFRFTSSEEASAYERALVLAVKDAKSRAALMAKELGVTLGEVVAISERGGNMPAPVMRAEMMMKDSSPSMPGQTQTSAQVNVRFAINQ